jgi:hypothetical protein
MTKVTRKQLDDRDHVLMLRETRRKAKEFQKHQTDIGMYNKKAVVKVQDKKNKVDVMA